MVILSVLAVLPHTAVGLGEDLEYLNVLLPCCADTAVALEEERICEWNSEPHQEEAKK